MLPGPVNFSWTGQDNATATGSLRYQYLIDGGPWTPAPPATDTGTTLTGLAEGSHTFKVRAIDSSGNTDATPAVRNFTIDGTPPTVLNVTVTNVTHRSARVEWMTNELTTGRLEYAFNDGEFLYTAASGASGTTHSVLLIGLGSNTPVRVRVRAQDVADNEAVSSVSNFTTDLLHDLSVSSADISFSNAMPGAGSSITMSARVRNVGNASGTATAVFFDQTPGGTAIEVGRQTVTVAALSNGVVATSAAFTVGEGLHTPFVQLESAMPADDITTNNTARKDLPVGAPSNRFTPAVSNPQTYPGDDGLFTATVTNTGSQPQSLTGAQVTGVSWVSLVSAVPPTPLNPGDAVQLTFRLTPPPDEPGGPAGNPVRKPVILTVTGGQAAPVNFQIEVFNGPPTTLDVTVKDALTQQPIPGATIALDGTDRTYLTGVDGTPVDQNGQPVNIVTTPGTRSVHAVAQGFTPASVSPNGAPIVFLLNRSGGLEVTEVRVRELTPQEIVERGVEVADPVNNHVFDFVLGLRIEPLEIPNVVLPVNPPGGTIVTGGAFVPGGGGGGGGGGGYTVAYTFTYTPTGRRETWIIIPGDVRILKQFWEATVMIRNTTGVTLNDVRATLNVPQGISLPDLNGLEQPATKMLAPLAPGGITQADWVIRGDRPGRYRLTGQAAADGITPVSLQSNEFEVASPKLKITFIAPPYVVAGQLFNVGISVKNESTIPLNRVEVRIKAEKLVNCVLEGTPLLELETIPVGETRTASFTFRSLVTGRVVETRAFVSGPVEPEVQVTLEPLIWTGRTSDDWCHDQNWSPPLTPPTGATVLIPFAGPSNNPVLHCNAILDTLTIEAGRSVTLAGGSLTINGTLDLTGGGILNTGSNSLILGTSAVVIRADGGRIIGNVRKQFSSPSAFTFPVGTANGYSPLQVNVTAGSGELTVRAVEGTQPSLNGATTLRRFWVLQGTGLTADLTFNYLHSDVVGNEANYKLVKVTPGSIFPFPHDPPNVVIDTTNNTATINSSFTNSGSNR